MVSWISRSVNHPGPRQSQPQYTNLARNQYFLSCVCSSIYIRRKYFSDLKFVLLCLHWYLKVKVGVEHGVSNKYDYDVTKWRCYFLPKSVLMFPYVF